MNTSLVGVKSEYLYLGGINILVESRYLAQINTLPFYFHLKPPILICVVRVIQCRYILIQNTFITEASYGKFFFFITALLHSIFTMLTLQRYSERGIMPEYVRKRIICLLPFLTKSRCLILLLWNSVKLNPATTMSSLLWLKRAKKGLIWKIVPPRQFIKWVSLRLTSHKQK